MTPTIIVDAKGSCLRSLHAVRTKDPADGFKLWLKLYVDPALAMTAPRKVIFVWDGGNDLRRGWYPNYKGNHTPEDERDPAATKAESRITKLVKGFLAAIGAMQISCPMTEADDVIALLAKTLPGPLWIHTGDKDLVALHGGDVEVIYKGEPVQGGLDGLPCNLITLNKSLVGDSSDNYSGVPGIGPKTWDWAVNEYGFDGLLELDELIRTGNRTELEDIAREGDDKFLQKLSDEWPRWELMYRLARFHPESCYRTYKGKIVRPEFYCRVPSQDRLAWVLEQAGLYASHMDRYHYWLPIHQLVTEGNLDDFMDHFLRHLPETEIVSFDYETYDNLNHAPFQDAKPATVEYYLDALSHRATGASFNYGANLQYTAYISVDHADTDNVGKQVIADLLTRIPADKLYAHNTAFENVISQVDPGIGIELDCPGDTKILASFIDEDDLKGLKHLSSKHLNYNQATYKETLEAAGVANMQDLTGDQVLRYGCDDSLVTGWLATLFILSTRMEGTYEGIRQYEFPCVHPLNHSFIRGVNVDINRLAELEVEDAELIRSGMDMIRTTLAEHCSEINPEGALGYVRDQTPYKAAKMMADGKSEHQTQASIDAFKDKMVAASQYLPRQEVRKVVEFKPTKGQFQKVCTALGIVFDIPDRVTEDMLKGVLSELPEDCFELTFPNPSARGITAWLAEVHAWIDTDPQVPDPDAVEQFLRLLPPAVPGLKDRKGPEYLALVDFCSGVLSKDAPTEWIGDELNFGSPVQSAQLLYCKLNLPIRVRTKPIMKSARYQMGFDPAPATDSKAIETAIAEDCYDKDAWKRPVLEGIRDVKAAITRGQLYYKPYPLWVHPVDGMIHPQIINCGTATHRPTGSSPNFLQLTKKDGGKIRSSVKPWRDDHVIISPDFSGQELRILASESQDPVLLDAYLPPEGQAEKDIHSLTGSAIVMHVLNREAPELLQLVNHTNAGVDYDDYIAILSAKLDTEQWLDEHGAEQTELYKRLQGILKQSRKDAKPVNFLINYLGGANTLARNMGIPKAVAQRFMDMTFERYARVKPWQQEMIRFAAEHGYTQTAYGTRRHMTKDILSRDGSVRSRMERQAVNFIIQGCAARILKIVLTEVWKTRLLQDTGAIIIAPVYDELTASVPRSAAVEYIERLSSIMAVTPPGHPIPMKPEVDIGNDWGNLLELGAYPSVDRIEEALDKLAAAKGGMK